MSEQPAEGNPTPSAAPGAPTDRERSAGGETTTGDASGSSTPSTGSTSDSAPGDGAARRRRGSRGGRNRTRPRSEADGGDDAGAGDDAGDGAGSAQAGDDGRAPSEDRNPELPDRHIEGRPSSVEAAERALVRKPQIGDTRPAPAPAQAVAASAGAATPSATDPDAPAKRRRRRGGRKRSGGGGGGGGGAARRDGAQPVRAVIDDEPIELDEEVLAERRGRSRKGKPVGRYLMCVSVRPEATQIAVLEGRHLIEHYVSKPSDDVAQIHGNIYVGRVENVLPGMEAAFVDIGTPKNAVLYRGDVQYEAEDIVEGGKPKIEQMLRARQLIICQVTKNPIAHKGARLTQEVSLPGRFVVLVPNSSTYGISKRLPDDERKRLRKILDRVRPAEHGVIVRTAAENITAEEIERDLARLVGQWEQIAALASGTSTPALLYREPDLAVRIIREEFSRDYRGIVIDDAGLHEEMRGYVASVAPALVERVQHYDAADEGLPLFERHHVHEQLHKAVDRKVWLRSGGSLIIEHTEALTVIDVNTGKNVGRSSLEETVFQNNVEAAEEIARQLRLRDIGGIIVIDFVDMESRRNRDETIRVFRAALARDKTRTQVFDISELGLVEMTRKRIGEGLLESLTLRCPECDGRGVQIDRGLLPD